MKLHLTKKALTVCALLLLPTAFADPPLLDQLPADFKPDRVIVVDALPYLGDKMLDSYRFIPLLQHKYGMQLNITYVAKFRGTGDPVADSGLRESPTLEILPTPDIDDLSKASGEKIGTEFGKRLVQELGPRLTSKTLILVRNGTKIYRQFFYDTGSYPNQDHFFDDAVLVASLLKVFNQNKLTTIVQGDRRLGRGTELYEFTKDGHATTVEKAAVNSDGEKNAYTMFDENLGQWFDHTAIAEHGYLRPEHLSAAATPAEFSDWYRQAGITQKDFYLFNFNTSIAKYTSRRDIPLADIHLMLLSRMLERYPDKAILVVRPQLPIDPAKATDATVRWNLEKLQAQAQIIELGIEYLQRKYPGRIAYIEDSQRSLLNAAVDNAHGVISANSGLVHVANARRGLLTPEKKAAGIAEVLSIGIADDAGRWHVPGQPSIPFFSTRPIPKELHSIIEAMDAIDIKLPAKATVGTVKIEDVFAKETIHQGVDAYLKEPMQFIGGSGFVSLVTSTSTDLELLHKIHAHIEAGDLEDYPMYRDKLKAETSKRILELGGKVSDCATDLGKRSPPQ